MCNKAIGNALTGIAAAELGAFAFPALGLGSAAVGAGIGSAAGSAITGGSPTQDLVSGITGYGVSSLLGGGASGAGDLTQTNAPVVDAGVSTGTGGDVASFSAPTLDTSGASSGIGSFIDPASSLMSGPIDSSGFSSGGAPGVQPGDIFGSTGTPIGDASFSGTGGADQSYWQKLQSMFGGGSPGSTTGGMGKMGPISGTLGMAGGLYQLYNGYQLSQAAKNLQDPNTGQYQQQLQQLISNPSSYQNTPAYQAQYGAGMQALARQQASGGYGGTGAAPGTGGGSGNFATAAQVYGQNLAQSGLSQQEQLLSNLAQGNPGAIQAGATANASMGQGLFGLGMGARMMGL